MNRWRRWSPLLLVLATACASGTGLNLRGGGGAAAPTGGSTAPDAPWTLTVDTSETSSYQALEARTVPVVGSVVATAGLASLDVDGMPATVGADRRFRAPAALEAGLTHVEIEARDAAGHRRQADRAFLATPYAPRGTLSPAVAAVPLDQRRIDALVAVLRDQVGTVNLAEALPPGRLLSAGPCTVDIVSITNGQPLLGAAADRDGIRATIALPQLRVVVRGDCNALGLQVGMTATLTTDASAQTTITAPLQETCVTALGHRDVDVDLSRFHIELRTHSFIVDLVLDAITSLAEGTIRRFLEAELTRQADALLTSSLRMIDVLRTSVEVDLLGSPVTLDVCLTGLEPGAVPRARVGASVRGVAPGTAPGAPYWPGDEPTNGAAIDTGLLGALVHAGWAAGSFRMTDLTTIDPGLLGRGVAAALPPGSTLSVDLEVGMPPLVRAGETSDVRVEVGDLDLEMRAGDREVVRIGTVLRADVDVVMSATSLGLHIAGVSAEAWVKNEPIADLDDRLLTRLVQSQMETLAPTMLEGLSIPLPELVAGLGVRDVTPDPGGRYLRIVLD